MKRLTIAGALLLAACTDPDSARRALEEQGYTAIQFTGYDVFACSEDDTFHTGFVATSAAGRQVRGVVCSGYLKGTTIRTI